MTPPSITSRDFELRKSVYTITPQNQRMIDIAREHGTHANYAGSGGAVIGVRPLGPEWTRMEEAYRSAGFIVIEAHPIDYKG